MGIQDSVQKNLENLKNFMSTLNSRTYFDTGKNRSTLNKLKNDMDDSIGQLVTKTNDFNGKNISKLYSRDSVNIGDKDMINDLNNIFEDDSSIDSLMLNYMENKYIKEQDAEIDLICKFMTKLEDAIEFKTDMVLSADDISKEFLVCKNVTTVAYQEQFSSKIEQIKHEHNLNILTEEVLHKTHKYGEQFIYVPKYSTEISKMLKHAKHSPETYNESMVLKESVLSVETFNEEKIFDDDDLKILEEFGDIKLEFSKSPVIESIAENVAVINEAQNIQPKLINTDSELETKYLKASESIVNTDKQEKDPNIKVDGCIIRKLKRENVMPIYIDDICLGYYYIETTVNNSFDYVETLTNPTSGIMNKNMYSHTKMVDEEKKNVFIKKLSGVLSKKIDEKFINANHGLKNEIYLLLKHYNLNTNNGNVSKIKVTFIPPEDMVHFYFKQDPNTHRGISDLSRSLFPAKLYTCLYIFNGIGTLTRSQDKRAYFVKQHVDTNIAGLLMNTVNQIKKGNFGFREMGNLDNILNMTGRFNDYVIPTSGSGEKPIEFEIIPGQDINVNTELMESLESLAINATGIPLEAIESRRSIEFSRQLTTTNGKIARHIVKRQSLFQVPTGKLVSKIYNSTFDENEIISVMLPPPSYLLVSNMMDMFNNVNNVVDGLIGLELTDDERATNWGQEYRRLMLRQWLGGYINMANMQELKKTAKLNIAAKMEDPEEE